jgi:hypothetical protein
MAFSSESDKKAGTASKIMHVYKIAGLILNMQAGGDILARQSPPYLTDSARPVDFNIALSNDFLLQKQQEYPHLSLDECEYIWTGSDFYRRLLHYNGLMLHASALAYEGRAYLFSAPCGTGKSTHARQWQEHFGSDQVQIINDDKPAIRLIDNIFQVFGTPWSGKSELNLNKQVPLQAICFLQQSARNWIEPLDCKAALKQLLNQTLRPSNTEAMGNLLTLLDKLLRQIPIFKMGCNISSNAVLTAYQAMSPG